MTLTQVWGSLVIFVVCPILGGLPLINWIFRAATGRQLRQMGTGNVSVSAAFYHSGRWIGILAVLSEALKGIVAVLIARYFFPTDPAWEVIALISLVMGRYWGSRGAGTTNVVWGYVVHDPIAAGLVLLVSSISFTIVRERRQGKLMVLVLLPIMAALRHPNDGPRVIATVLLSILMAWIYQKIPDDLDLPTRSAQGSSQTMFRFFRGDRALLSLDQQLDAARVGNKAANLAQLKRWGYPVPMGWVLPPGDDPTPLIEFLQPTAEAPVIVRSSAIGEDTDTASAAGQYESIGQVTSQAALGQAIARCQMSYNLPAAVQYRRDRSVKDAAMAVLVQTQVRGAFSGVAFSRDPLTRQGDAVLIEALPGTVSKIVSGQVTPEEYRVWVREGTVVAPAERENQEDHHEDGSPDWILPNDIELAIEGAGDVPPRLIQQVAYLVRHIEARYHGVPQDIEWSYDGQQLWVLQTRPITTLLPIWTRKIAAEVIPGFIPPLTWSINRPLTCGVWGDIFTIVLGDRARGLDFTETATLHHSSAYFNASLLGQTFLRMGLPAESLEFLTRGAKFSKPPIASTLKNVPGLLRLLGRELRLEKDFQVDEAYFQSTLTEFRQQPAQTLSVEALITRIHQTLEALRRATYYSILAPLSLSLRQALLKVDDQTLDPSQTPEVASLRSLQTLAVDSRSLLDLTQLSPNTSTVFAALAENADGQTVLVQIDRFLDRFGYLSDVATDIAVPTWREDPHPVRELFTQYLFNPPPAGQTTPDKKGWKAQQVQRRLNLKGRVTEAYSQLLAHLRWSFVALEERWIESGVLAASGDIFYLRFAEVEQLASGSNPDLVDRVADLVAARRSQLDQDREQQAVAMLVYGNDPPKLRELGFSAAPQQIVSQLKGIGASPGQVEGRVLVLRNLQNIPTVDQDTILVVPYTDSGWSPLLARAGGLIAEVGGRLSHGAIVAREYGIPAVMNIHDATHKLYDGQRVRLDGQQGTVEVL